MANASFWLTDHLLLDGSLSAICPTTTISSTTTARRMTRRCTVRTHIRDYVENDVYVSNLQVNYMHELGNDSTATLRRLSGDDVRWAGGEVLYRPLDASWAVGVDANYVKRRDWNNMMKFTDYTARVGNITAYWQPWFMRNLLVKASRCQYLAEDKGLRWTCRRPLTAGLS